MCTAVKFTETNDNMSRSAKRVQANYADSQHRGGLERRVFGKQPGPFSTEQVLSFFKLGLGTESGSRFFSRAVSVH